MEASQGVVFTLTLLLIVLILCSCRNTELFTAPALTLGRPPSWWAPQTPYKQKNWETPVYPDRYPIWTFKDQNTETANALSQAYRFWPVIS